jgi:hypothetical protein
MGGDLVGDGTWDSRAGGSHIFTLVSKYRKPTSGSSYLSIFQLYFLAACEYSAWRAPVLLSPSFHPHHRIT